jgi:hypothetical protein
VRIVFVGRMEEEEEVLLLLLLFKVKVKKVSGDAVCCWVCWRRSVWMMFWDIFCTGGVLGGVSSRVEGDDGVSLLLSALVLGWRMMRMMSFERWTSVFFFLLLPEEG